MDGQLKKSAGWRRAGAGLSRDGTLGLASRVQVQMIGKLKSGGGTVAAGAFERRSGIFAGTLGYGPGMR